MTTDQVALAMALASLAPHFRFLGQGYLSVCPFMLVLVSLSATYGLEDLMC